MSPNLTTEQKGTNNNTALVLSAQPSPAKPSPPPPFSSPHQQTPRPTPKHRINHLTRYDCRSKALARPSSHRSSHAASALPLMVIVPLTLGAWDDGAGVATGTGVGTGALVLPGASGDGVTSIWGAGVGTSGAIGASVLGIASGSMGGLIGRAVGRPTTGRKVGAPGGGGGR